MNEHVKHTDPEIAAILDAELARQRDGVELIASENFPSVAVLPSMGIEARHRDPRMGDPQFPADLIRHADHLIFPLLFAAVAGFAQ